MKLHCDISNNKIIGLKSPQQSMEMIPPSEETPVWPCPLAVVAQPRGCSAPHLLEPAPPEGGLGTTSPPTTALEPLESSLCVPQPLRLTIPPVPHSRPPHCCGSKPFCLSLCLWHVTILLAQLSIVSKLPSWNPPQTCSCSLTKRGKAAAKLCLGYYLCVNLGVVSAVFTAALPQGLLFALTHWNNSSGFVQKYYTDFLPKQ